LVQNLRGAQYRIHNRLVYRRAVSLKVLGRPSNSPSEAIGSGLSTEMDSPFSSNSTRFLPKLGMVDCRMEVLSVSKLTQPASNFYNIKINVRSDFVYEIMEVEKIVMR
jgi:hypothetical protein